MSKEIDYRILYRINQNLSEERLTEIGQALADYFDEYMRFREIGNTARKGKKKDGLDGREIKSDWNQYARMSGSQFQKLIETYYLRYKENARKRGRKGTVTELNEELSGHNKWYRMIRDRGIGAQYRDDMRKLCFLFELSYAEAIELLWSAGHPFDGGSVRDYVIAECLVRGIYKEDEVDRCLIEAGGKPLFYEEL